MACIQPGHCQLGMQLRIIPILSRGIKESGILVHPNKDISKRITECQGMQ